MRCGPENDHAGGKRAMTMDTARNPGRGADMAAAGGVAALGAEAVAGRASYGADALVACDRLVRIYATDGIEVQALQGLDLLVGRGELTAVVGASGSGKSTLMNILAGLDAPTAGAVTVAGHDLAAMSARERVAYRRAVVGFIWQQTARNLLPYLTALQNVILPMRFAGRRRGRTARAMELLELLGVGHRAGEPARAAARRRAHRRAGQRHRARGVRRPAGGQRRAGRDRAARHARSRSLRAGPPDGGDPGRTDQHRDAAAGRRRRRRPRARGGVRGARPGRPAAAATGDDRAAGHARPGPAAGRARPHRRLAGRPLREDPSPGGPWPRRAPRVPAGALSPRRRLR